MVHRSSLRLTLLILNLWIGVGVLGVEALFPSPSDVISDAIETVGDVVNNAASLAGNVVDIVTSALTSKTILADTNGGRVKGKSDISRSGKKFYAFKGIPYAKPPVEQLRFEPPLKHPGWRGVLDATNYRSMCLQTDPVTRLNTGRENCLYLNVFTQKAYLRDQLRNRNSKLHPVIFFIHGGFFHFGGSDSYPPKYFLDEDVVLVTINYRLASLGFLNTGDGVVKGNMGLKDQSMALSWVYDNIIYFNGDNNRIIVSGESAGGVSAHLHILSPMSKGLFSGAISQSGTALTAWGLIKNHTGQARMYAQSLGCLRHNSQMTVQCLKSLPAKKLARHHSTYMNVIAQSKHLSFGPTVEGNYPDAFLPAHPLTLLKQGNFPNVPWVTGVNSGEGVIQLIPILRNETMRRLVNKKWKEIIPNLLEYLDNPQRDFISDSVKQFYFDNQPISKPNAKMAVEMISDRNFFLDNHDSAILHAKVAPVYLYYYTYQGLVSLANLMFTLFPFSLPFDIGYLFGTGFSWVTANIFGIRKKSPVGISHYDEMPLLFNIPGLRKEINALDSDYKFSKKFVKLWVSFADKLIPSPRQAGENIRWESVQVWNPGLRDEPLKRLELNQQFSVVEEPFFDNLLFWKSVNITSI